MQSFEAKKTKNKNLNSKLFWLKIPYPFKKADDEMGFNFRKYKDFAKGSKSRKMSAGFLNELSALPIREKRSWIWWIMMDFTYLNWLTRICSSGSRSKLHYNSNSFQNFQFSRQKTDVKTLRKRAVEASCSPIRRRLKTKESLPCFDGLAADGDLQEKKAVGLYFYGYSIGFFYSSFFIIGL